MARGGSIATGRLGEDDPAQILFGLRPSIKRLIRKEEQSGDRHYEFFVSEECSNFDEAREKGLLDRSDGPAVVQTVEGLRIEQWYRHGQLHRDGGPAVIEDLGDAGRTEEWFREGKRHRADGPAVDFVNPTNEHRGEEWWLDGQQHREGGPALVDTDDFGQVQREEFWVNGKQHRDRSEGPAVINFDNGLFYAEFWEQGAPVEVPEGDEAAAIAAWKDEHGY